MWNINVCLRFWTLDSVTDVSKLLCACISLSLSLPVKCGVWSGAVEWRRRVLQSDDHREQWLITLVTMPVLWPWAPLLNQTASVNVQVNGACLGDVWNKLLLARKGSSAHHIALRCSVLPLLHVRAIFHIFLAVNIWWACKMQWVRSRNDKVDVKTMSGH